MNRRLLGLAAVGIAVWGSCLVPDPSYVGRQCAADSECPTDMTCVVTPQYSGRVCQSNHVQFADQDAGVAFYCSSAKAVLDTYCITCHSDVPTNSAPATFRLDVYADAGTKPGAAAYAVRAAVRAAQTKDMPPVTFSPQPSEAQRRTLLAWAQAGAPLCEPDGGTP